jgi:hypothetical protein
VLSATIGVAWLLDRVPDVTVLAPRGRHAPHALLAIALCAAGVSVFTVGRAYFCVKPVMMPSIDRWYFIAAYCAPLCFAAAAAERAWATVAVAAVLLLLDSLIGFRAGLAIACMATALVYGEAMLSAGWKSFGAVFLAALLAGLAFVGMREVMIQVKYQLEPLCVPTAAEPVHLPGSPDALPRTRAGQPIVDPPRQPFRADLLSRMMGEPAIVQMSLNEVVRQHFVVDRSHLIEQLKTAIPGAWVVFGIDLSEAKAFNLLYQPFLFPRAALGLANNPWAQAYASGGFYMVAVFAAGYAIGLGMLTVLFRSTEGVPRAMVAVLASWWGFYSHRNDLMTEIGIVKMVVYSAAVALVIAWLVERRRDRIASARPVANLFRRQR